MPAQWPLPVRKRIKTGIKNGLGTRIAPRFSADCGKLGIIGHRTFVRRLPGAAPETIDKAIDHGWLQRTDGHNLVNDKSVQFFHFLHAHDAP